MSQNSKGALKPRGNQYGSQFSPPFFGNGAATETLIMQDDLYPYAAGTNINGLTPTYSRNTSNWYDAGLTYRALTTNSGEFSGIGVGTYHYGRILEPFTTNLKAKIVQHQDAGSSAVFRSVVCSNVGMTDGWLTQANWSGSTILSIIELVSSVENVRASVGIGAVTYPNTDIIETVFEEGSKVAVTIVGTGETVSYEAAVTKHGEYHGASSYRNFASFGQYAFQPEAIQLWEY